MAHRHRRQLSEPLPNDMDLCENCISSSSSSSSSKPPSPSFKIFRASCFPLKLKTSQNNINMANTIQCTHLVSPRNDPMKKSVIGLSKRQELEQEVADLQKTLENEEKVNEVLERALLPKDGRSPLHIPTFLPKKTKELLAELVMVEEEIARLESEINKIQRCSSQLREEKTNESFEVIQHKQQNNTSTTPIVMEEKVVQKTKPMFFINQAIKGDYSLHGFISKGKNDNKIVTINTKQSSKVSGIKERVPKKSGVITKQSSLKPPSHSSAKISDATENLFKILKEPSTNVNSPERNGHRLQPNKLSEKIMKCLVCIFMRLIRTSRVSELEKSGNVSRSSISYSRNVRFESGMYLNATLVTQKEKGQLDPYGIFEIEDSLVRDIGPYKNLVRFTASSLDLNSISSSLQLLRKLRDLVNNLRDVDLRFLTDHQKLAFWINIYNICIMNGFLQHGLPSNPEKIIALKNKAMLDIGGNKLNALAIEHFILRQPSIKEGDKDDKEGTTRSIYGLETPEPKITFALCSGNRSSPSVRIYTADGVSSEMEKSKQEYLQASIVVTAAKRVMVPKLLVANMQDFAKDLGSLVEWICNQLPTSGSLRKSMADCLKGQSNASDIVDIIPCDFGFQYLLPM